MYKSNIFYFILGAIIFCSIGVYAVSVNAIDIDYDNTNSNLNTNNVQEAINILYEKVSYGDATPQDIINGKKAFVNGNQIVGQAIVPEYTTLSNNETIDPGTNSSERTGYYYLENYSVTCASCIAKKMNWTLSTSKNGSTIQSVDNDGYYLVFGNNIWTIQNGGTLLSSITNIGTIRGSNTYTAIVKATSTTMVFSNSVFAIKIGY